jgi:hypothetical protein
MLTLDYSAAHTFMRTQRQLGNKIRWDGWDMVIFKPTAYGFKDVKGAFRDGRWGVEKRIPVNADGQWEVSKKDVFTTRKPRG